jgi:excinuclease UvrABC nuclease subunit
MVENIRDIEWIVVASELEALILEMNLIKEQSTFL